ncbi:sensor histidine kinase [Gammaproteobacteria bacterium AB-CW1]|uniref:Oxygen sensor histidine kinase NreB n=1 Tax=Natronospira elongata TaxID=3110268 RepID=A0AAP6MJY5_9GAMM|nr:sensor histidine kinase [Gammaproteobacteria bacterium AB-CW1]
MIFKRLSRRSRQDADRLQALEQQNDALFSELAQVQQRFGGLARSVWRVQEEERRHIARELHDSVGQTLTALCHRVESLDGDSAARDAAASLCRQALEEVRELSRLLRPPVLDDLGLVPALKWLARRVRESHGIPVNVRAGDESVGVDSDAETLIFRVAQESLSNAVRHGRPTRIDIRLTRIGNRLELQVRDNGEGFDPEAVETREERGIGLAGMRDRVSLFGGELLISSSPGRGTMVSASLVLDRGEGDGDH